MGGFSAINIADGKVGEVIHTWTRHPVVELGR